MPAIGYQNNQQIGLHACMHVSNTQECKALQQITPPIVSQSNACAISIGEIKTRPSTCMDENYSHDMQPKPAHDINSGHYVQPIRLQPQVECVIDESHDTYRKLSQVQIHQKSKIATIATSHGSDSSRNEDDQKYSNQYNEHMCT